jgi:hypothetical protein
MQAFGLLMVGQALDAVQPHGHAIFCRRVCGFPVS